MGCKAPGCVPQPICDKRQPYGERRAGDSQHGGATARMLGRNAHGADVSVRNETGVAVGENERYGRT